MVRNSGSSGSRLTGYTTDELNGRKFRGSRLTYYTTDELNGKKFRLIRKQTYSLYNG